MARIYSPIGCPTLDKLCGGGVPHESIIYIYGGPGLGKTTLALNMVKAMGTGVWVDASHSLSDSYAQVEGVPDIAIIQPTNACDLKAYLPLIGATPIIVIDDLTTLSEDLAKPLQVFIRKTKELLPGSGTTLLLTNQVRECRNGQLPPGGLSYTKYSDLVLELGPRHKRVGDVLTVEVSIVRSTVGPCQGVRTLPFRHGLYKVQDIITTAIRLGVIKQAGSWYEYKGSRVHGMDRLELSLEQDTINEIYEEVMECS